MINSDKKFTTYPEGQKRRLPTDIWHVSWWLYDDGRFLPGLWISTKGISEMNRWVKIISSSSPILHSEKTKKIPKPPVRHWTANKTFFSIECKILKVASSLEIEITEQSLKWLTPGWLFPPSFINQAGFKSLETLCGGQFTLLTEVIKPNYHVIPHHLRSTRFSLKTYVLCYKKINDFNDNGYITEICWEATERLNCILKQILMIRDSSAFHSFSIVTWSWYGQYKTRLQFSTLAPFITFKSITSKRLWTKFTIPRSPHFTFVLKTHLNCKETSVQFY